MNEIDMRGRCYHPSQSPVGGRGPVTFLLVSADDRLLRSLREASPSTTVERVPDLAGASRALNRADFDGVAVDGMLLRSERDIARVKALIGVRGSLVIVEPSLVGGEVTPRRAADVLAALRGEPVARLVVCECALVAGEARVSLTKTETTVLATLARADGSRSSKELQEEALGYEGGGNSVRAHVGSVRRKCDEAGVPWPVLTTNRRYVARGVRVVD